jgi:hypothetical protein
LWRKWHGLAPYPGKTSKLNIAYRICLLSHATFLEFLAAAAWTRIIPPDFLFRFLRLRRMKEPVYFSNIFWFIRFYSYNHFPTVIIANFQYLLSSF